MGQLRWSLRAVGITDCDARVSWTEASDLAQHFVTVRDATRAAMRLPSRFRAFALPVMHA